MDWLWVLFGYLFGSIPTGYLTVKVLRGDDIRRYGSGNIGATNVGRLLGRRWAMAVGAFDIVKGGLAVMLARLWIDDHFILALVGVASVCGHVFPLWLKFRGGKGVATTFGVVFSYHPLVALASGALWWILVRLFRYVSLASMISLSCAPFFFWLLGADRVYIFASASLAALTIARHKDNIERLLSGTENRVGRPTKGP